MFGSGVNNISGSARNPVPGVRVPVGTAGYVLLMRYRGIWDVALRLIHAPRFETVTFASSDFVKRRKSNFFTMSR